MTDLVWRTHIQSNASLPSGVCRLAALQSVAPRASSADQLHPIPPTPIQEEKLLVGNPLVLSYYDDTDF